MQNSPDLLTRALQNPTLLEGRARCPSRARRHRPRRPGLDRSHLRGPHSFPPWRAVKGTWRPAKAFCDALFARDSVVLWIASRGFGGKTFLLALLAAANAILFETDVIILGGSGQQSARVVECLHRLLAAGQVPPAWLASAPTFTKTTFAWGNTIQALKASQTAVRGAHPTRLLLDEIDEMELRNSGSRPGTAHGPRRRAGTDRDELHPSASRWHGHGHAASGGRPGLARLRVVLSGNARTPTGG